MHSQKLAVHGKLSQCSAVGHTILLQNVKFMKSDQTHHVCIKQPLVQPLADPLT
uniref:Uncharacterized protein n=1 Tax=Anguilla anguilla TaxID=7936 RepID=A0A0E9V5S8_ANGAN